MIIDWVLVSIVLYSITAGFYIFNWLNAILTAQGEVRMVNIIAAIFGGIFWPFMLGWYLADTIRNR